MRRAALRGSEEKFAAKLFESARLESIRLTFFKSLDVLTVNVYPDNWSRKYLLAAIEVEVLGAGCPLFLILRDRDQKPFSFIPSKTHEMNIMKDREFLREWCRP